MKITHKKPVRTQKSNPLCWADHGNKRFPKNVPWRKTLTNTGGNNAMPLLFAEAEVAGAEAGAVARSIPNAFELSPSGTVENQASKVVGRGPFKGELASPYTNSRLTMQEIMSAKPPIPDPQGVPGVLRWDVPGTFRARMEYGSWW